MSATSPAPDAATPILSDPLAEARRLVEDGERQGVVLRLLGGVAVCVQAPGAQPLLPRPVRDIDFVTSKGASKRAVEAFFTEAGYVSDEAFNAFHGHHRQLYVDLHNERKVDVFVGAFAMCHAVPIAERLDRDPLTVPLAELLLTKLQIVQLNERDERDIYNLLFHHDLAEIDADRVAELCARDWGLWRTCRGTIDRCRADAGNYGLADDHRTLISARLGELWERIEGAPKTSKWRMRNRVGDRVRWYEEPEEEGESV